MVFDTKLYDILKISPNSDNNEIRKAYLKLAKRFHPDKNPNDKNAEEFFKKINQAYGILFNPNERKIYDQYGYDYIMKTPSSQDNNNNFFNNNNEQNFFTNVVNLIADIKITLYLTLEECYNGCLKKVSYSKNIKCESCNATGIKNANVKTCPICKGVGKTNILLNFNNLIQNGFTKCFFCRGTGMYVKPENNIKCEKCLGEKVIPIDAETDFYFKGVNFEKEHVLYDLGHENVFSKTKTNLIIKVEPKEHDRFKIKNEHLYTSFQLNLIQALEGFSFQIKHLNDDIIFIENNSDNVIQPNELKMIKGYGMPKLKQNSNNNNNSFQYDYGDLYVEFLVKLPQKITENNINKNTTLLEKKKIKYYKKTIKYLSKYLSFSIEKNFYGNDEFQLTNIVHDENIPDFFEEKNNNDDEKQQSTNKSFQKKFQKDVFFSDESCVQQ